MRTELVSRLAKELFKIDCEIMTPDQPLNWDRATKEARGFKTEVVLWEAIAHRAIRFLDEGI